MKVNMLEAKSQLSRLVKSALAGEDVVIARDGEAAVRLVPVEPRDGLRHWGTLESLAGDIDAAFTADVDAAVARQFELGDAAS